MLASKLAAATPMTGHGMEINVLTVVLRGGVAFTEVLGASQECLPVSFSWAYCETA
jgi:hypothetical protein